MFSTNVLKSLWRISKVFHIEFPQILKELQVKTVFNQCCLCHGLSPSPCISCTCSGLFWTSLSLYFNMMFVCSDHFLTNGDISLLRQLYSKDTVLFNLTISGNDAFSALPDVCRKPVKPVIWSTNTEIFVLVLGVICTLLSEVE